MNKHQTDTVALSIQNLHHKYQDRTVLKEINLEIYKGEICALIGENSAGKTTLLRILDGSLSQEKGRITVCGRELNAHLRKRVPNSGIYYIEQEPQMAEMLTVEQTIFLGWELTTTKWIPTVRRSEHQYRIKKAMEELGVRISPHMKISDLSLYDRKIVLMIRCLLQKANVLLMDDPMLGFAEEQKCSFANLIQILSKNGMAILFTSYQSDEIEMLAERIIVLNEGRIISDETLHGNDRVKEIVYSIAGLSKKNCYPKSICRPGKPLFEMQDISSRDGYLKNIDIHFNTGEIIGVVPGNEKEKENLIALLTGAATPAKGSIFWKGNNCILKSIEDAARRGISFLSDRNVLNVYQDKSVEFNVSLPNLDAIFGGLYLKTKIIREFVEKYLNRIHSENINIDVDAGKYSYGFQRKVALARILCTSKVFHVMVEPTAGLDSASCIEIYNVINQLALHNQGVALISMNVDDLVGMCDRIYVITDGKVQQEYNRNNFSGLKCIR